jgi:polyferredoxin
MSQIKLDFLAWKPVRFVVMSPAFPVALQAAALGVIGWLALNGLGIGPDWKAEDLMSLRKTNLTTLVVWGLWWPAMIGMALVLGRAWCTVCPMELVNRAGDTVARKVGWPRARLGKFLRAGWFIIVLYLALQLLVAGLSIHRVPHYTSIFLLVLLSGAIITGLVFREPRSFCRAFCPAGALLSVYGR